jgi:phosphohistidine swiveling domain-containing protein
MEEMNIENAKKIAKELGWKKWIRRPFGTFVLSLFERAGTPEFSVKAGFNKDCTLKAQFFQNGVWYESEKVFDINSPGLERYLKKHSIKDMSNNLNKFHKKAISRIKAINKSKDEPLKKLRKIYDILTVATTFTWETHVIEHIFNKRIKSEVEKYVKHDIDKFIGDASFPEKKNINALMEEEMIKGISSEKIAKKYGWLKTRDGFSEPFSAKEIENMRREVKKSSPHKYPEMPKQLAKLFKEVQELVWFRTARTDVLYHLMFLSRPSLIQVAEKFKMSFEDLRDCYIPSLLLGKPEKYPYPNFSWFVYEGKGTYSTREILEEESHAGITETKGLVAFKGKVKGIAKVVYLVNELEKVKKGDILVTQMTFPNFIAAMQRAAAFVTDEGGITCHAAIVAREMRKPCIIGTKIATKIFKDGDLIEVDAYNGIVKKV